MIWKSPGLDNNKKSPTRWFKSWPNERSPNLGGHQQPFKGSRFHHPKKVTIAELPGTSSFWCFHPYLFVSSHHEIQWFCLRFPTKLVDETSLFSFRVWPEEKADTNGRPKEVPPRQETKGKPPGKKNKRKEKGVLDVFFLRKRSGMIGVSAFFLKYNHPWN